MERRRWRTLITKGLAQLFLLLMIQSIGVSASSAAPPKCSSACADRAALRSAKLASVKSEILNRLGLSSPPNGTVLSSSRIQQFLRRYRHHNAALQRDEPFGGGSGSLFSGLLLDSEEDDSFQMQIINVLSSKVPEDYPFPLSHSDGFNTLYFNLESKQISSPLSRADLYIHLPRSPSGREAAASIRLYYISTSPSNGSRILLPARVARVGLKASKGGWVDLKVFDVVSYWLKYPSQNFGFALELSLSEEGGGSLSPSSSPEPYLKLDLSPGGPSRRKRTLSKVCNEETDADSTNCCLWPLEVDFHKEYGWEFIIFPSKYQANYCAGDCSLGVTPEYTHTHLMMQNQKSQAGTSPCCTPKKISPVPLMYIDENENVILGKIPNMKVDRCGCA